MKTTKKSFKVGIICFLLLIAIILVGIGVDTFQKVQLKQQALNFLSEQHLTESIVSENLTKESLFRKYQYQISFEQNPDIKLVFENKNKLSMVVFGKDYQEISPFFLEQPLLKYNQENK